MPLFIPPSMPGIGTTYTATPYPILQNNNGAQYIEGGRVIDSNARDYTNTGAVQFLKNGLVLGRITATGAYSPFILGITAGAVTTSSTSVSVTAAQAAELVRRVGATGNLQMSGPPSTSGTATSETIAFSAVDTTTGAITIANPAAAHIAGSIISAADGSQVPRVILETAGGYPLLVTDYLGTTGQNTQGPRLLIAGHLISANIPGYSALNADAKAYLKAALRLNGQLFVWDDDF